MHIKILAKSAPGILSIKGECTFIFSNFLMSFSVQFFRQLFVFRTNSCSFVYIRRRFICKQSGPFSIKNI